MNQHTRKSLYFLLIGLLLLVSPAFSQHDRAQISKAISGLQLREIGPALMGGRIADIAIHQDQPATWYVAAGSGNLWKTTNRGITWTPIFDHQNSYSIGTVTIDPENPNVVWVGTGENVSGRHVGWGDGVYRSTDGGRSWISKGLAGSEHIGKILIDPRDSDIIFVAAEGPLWSSGGERGVYKSVDGGNTWRAVLTKGPYTGVTDLEFDPSNPDVIYAATYQRFRRTWALMAGGPEGGLYKSVDGGDTWKQLTQGLPKGDIGKIGLAVTQANPNVVYATIEAGEKEKGFYRSMDKGESWEQRNSYISGGTGPHYYQELEASPQNPDLVYQMDVFLHVTRDGGKTMDYLTSGRTKHSDNHAMWIDPDDDLHLIAGTDGGLYETFDQGKTWRHFSNLPISQFYKLGVDNTKPFYNIIGGAQDLGTLIGPSRTTNVEGIQNRDWYVPLGADGYGSTYDWKDNTTAYIMWQQGSLVRLDVRTGETIFIKPQPVEGDTPERWNWDSPILVSPHNNKRIYFGSQRLWKSDNRGDAWEAISDDLTTNTNRYELELMDRVWSVNALYDNGAMSKYATLTTVDESPLVEGLLYTGSDDGILSVSEDGGQSWRRANLKIPARAFINDVVASRHDANTVFAVVDAHKLGDYHPYIFMSTDRGKSWQSISGDLPEGTIVWAIQQDGVTDDLLFIGTEYGIYFSYNKGNNWVKLGAGVPTIPFRDLVIQSRDDDLVGASFGRGFYVLDDYSPFRTIRDAVNQQSATVFPVRDAWWYVPTVPLQAKGMPSQGSANYVAENPPFGATITYYLPAQVKTSEEKRTERERQVRKTGGDISFPGWSMLNEERKESSPQVLLLIRDANGQAIRWLEGTNAEGLHRVSWDLRLAAPDPIRLKKPAFQPPWAGDAVGPMLAPGEYSVELYIEDNGQLSLQGQKRTFLVKPIPLLEQNDFDGIAAFMQQTHALLVQISSIGEQLGECSERLRFIYAALKKTPKVTNTHFDAWSKLDGRLSDLQVELYGDPARGSLDESRIPGIWGRIGNIAYGHWETTQPPTETFKANLTKVERDFPPFEEKVIAYLSDLAAFEAELKALGAPYTRGRKH